jgi:putative sugar O-methyltransferase
MRIRSAIKRAALEQARRTLGRVASTLHVGGSPALRRYGQMRSDNQAAAPLYQAGHMWDEINREFRDLIWAGGLDDLRDQYFNLRFSGVDPESRHAYDRLLWLYYQHVRDIDRLGVLGRIEDSPIGGTRTKARIEGRWVSLDFLQSVEEAYAILDAWAASGRHENPRLFIELGAGYGRLAYVIRNMFPDSTFVILDLPEALLCSSTWLERSLPGDVHPYEASREVDRLSRSELLQKKIWTLAAHQIEAIEADAADVFINIYSFAEMPLDAITNYFGHVDRLTRGIFYSKQRKLENNLADGGPIGEATYPIRPHWARHLYRTTSLQEGFFESAYATRSP